MNAQTGTLALLAAIASVAGLAIAWRTLGMKAAGARGSTWPVAGWIAAACIPAVAAVLYVMLSEPAAPRATPAPARRDAPHGIEGAGLDAMAQRLAARLREQPEDAAGWAMLGRSLAASGRFAEAAQAWGEAALRMPGNAAALAEQADVLAMAQGRRFEGEPDRLIAAALAADPRNVKALLIAGTSAFERGHYAVAARHWRLLLTLLPAKSAVARDVEAAAGEAERRAKAGMTAVLTGTVAFAPGVSATVAPADAIYVFARPSDGRGRPVAVTRLDKAALPSAFRLDDGDSLLPGAPLSGHSEVILEARLARGGSADPRPGDPRSAPRRARPGERAIVLELRAPAP